MQLLTQDDFAALMEPRNAPCVSIYIPTERAGKPAEQNAIRYKNALRDAATMLQEAGLRSTDANALLEPARALEQDGYFWRNQYEGLASFLAQDFQRHFRLPLRFEESVLVQERFRIKPLLPLLSQEGYFYILALSQNEVRLLRGTEYGVAPVELPNVPESLAKALRFDVAEEHLQAQSFTTNITGQAGIPSNNVAVFHGHGVGTDLAVHKEEIRQFLQKLDRGLEHVLREERAPMVLAGVEYVQAMFRDLSHYRHILPEGVSGNPELLRPEELRERAWPIAAPQFRRAFEDAAGRYRNLLGSGRVSTDFAGILGAAATGRVDTTFIARGINIWGTFVADDGKDPEYHFQKQPQSQDLLDVAAYLTVSQGGCVHTVEPDAMPDDCALAAIYRY